MKHVRFHLLLPIIVTVSIFTYSSQLLLTFSSSSLLFSLIHCDGYSALLKALHSHFWYDVLPCCSDSVTSGMMYYHVVVIHNY